MKTRYAVRIILSIICTFLFSLCYSQKFLNLGFEHSFNKKPSGWSVSGAGYDSGLDSAIVHSGKGSLRIQYASGNSFGVASQLFPVDLARGKKLHLSGWIKTDSITRGFAGLWCRVDGPKSMLAFDNMSDRGATGTTPWQRYEITLAVDASASNVVFGALIPGNGTAWFDDLQIELDGVRFVDTLTAVPITAEQTTWIRTHSMQISTPKAGNGFDDLRGLKAAIGNARIVSLGEATHGTKEFFQMKHRITEYLSSDMGFTLFAIEANMPEAYRVNDYVLYGKGDPKELLKGMYFWTWNTQEVLDMIEWMRKFNQSGKGKIQFLGFDMQTPDVALKIVGDFVRKVDEPYARTLDSLKSAVDSANSMQRRGQNPQSLMNSVLPLSNGVVEHLGKSRSAYIGTSSVGDVDWAIQNANIVAQAMKLAFSRSDPSGFSIRDSSMASNVGWILDHSPANSRIVLWAHNGHITKRKGFMGSYLSEKYGAKYIAIAQTCYAGLYTAIEQGKGLKSNNMIAPPLPGSLEAFLHSAGVPILALDVRTANADSKGSAWLKQPILMRSIGALAIDNQQFDARVTQEFDLVIYFEDTKATDCFGLTQSKN